MMCTKSTILKPLKAKRLNLELAGDDLLDFRITKRDLLNLVRSSVRRFRVAVSLGEHAK